MSNLKLQMNKFGLKIKKNAPELLVGMGIGISVTGTIFACKATLKVGDILSNRDEELDLLEEQVNDPANKEKLEEAGYDEKAYKKERASVKRDYIYRVAKVYAPSAGLVLGGIGLILGGMGVLKSRETAALSTATAIASSFEAYRSRVSNKYGEKIEHDIYTNKHEEEIETEELDKEGKPKKKKVVMADAPNVYARWYNPENQYWENDPSYNVSTLLQTQQFMNDKLNAKGHLFLNEVYDELALPRSKEGAIAGWIKNGNGDGYVDFGLPVDVEMRRMLLTDPKTRKEGFLLDFNVDGLIFDLI